MLSAQLYSNIGGYSVKATSPVVCYESSPYAQFSKNFFVILKNYLYLQKNSILCTVTRFATM